MCFAVLSTVLLLWTPLTSGAPAVTVGAQATTLWSHPDEPGAWLPWWNSCGAVSTSLRVQWEAQLKALAALVRACPVFGEIRGYYPELIGCVQSPGIPSDPYFASVALLIWPTETVERGAKGEPQVKRVWRFNQPGGDSRGTLRLLVNSTEGLRAWVVGEDKDGPLYELPKTTREIAGFPLMGSLLFVTAPNKPPLFEPIASERARRWIIDNLKRQAAADASILEAHQRAYEEFIGPEGRARRAKAIEEAAASQRKPENQEQARRHAVAIDQRREQDLKAATIPKAGSPQARTLERLAQLESRLAAMSPEERRGPAWYQRHADGVRRLDYGDIVAPGTAGARPLVVPNPSFFDTSLPKTAMQLVSVPYAGHYLSSRTTGATELAIVVPATVVEQVDWRAVAALLK